MTITKLAIERVTGRSGWSTLYITAATDEGHEAIYGPIDAEAAIVADRMLSPRVVGRNPFGHEAIWNDLFEADRHSRGSHYFMGISAIDNVLWDLKGRILGLPVYRLLGGDRRTLDVYGSCLGFSTEPGPMASKATELKAKGYARQKWFLNDTRPEQGPATLDANVEKARVLREALGSDADIMIDVLYKWDLPYAAAWAQRAERYHIRWLEEPVRSATLDAFVELARSTSVPIATGEHFYGRWDVQSFLERDAIRIVQADPEWCGGVSELVKICAIASVHGAYVIPHGHSLHAAMHVVAAQSPTVCPLVEYLINKMEGELYSLEADPPRAHDGTITIADRPGFGIELDAEKVAHREVISWREV